MVKSGYKVHVLSDCVTSYDLKKVDEMLEYYEKKDCEVRQRVVRIYDPDKHIIEVGENIKVVCKRFLDSGMTSEQVAERMDVPIKFVNACIR